MHPPPTRWFAWDVFAHHVYMTFFQMTVPHFIARAHDHLSSTTLTEILHCWAGEANKNSQENCTYWIIIGLNIHEVGGKRIRALCPVLATLLNIWLQFVEYLQKTDFSGDIRLVFGSGSDYLNRFDSILWWAMHYTSKHLNHTYLIAIDILSAK